MEQRKTCLSMRCKGGIHCMHGGFGYLHMNNSEMTEERMKLRKKKDWKNHYPYVKIKVGPPTSHRVQKLIVDKFRSQI